VVLFNEFKDFFEAQYAKGLSVLTDKSKGLRSGECEGHATGPLLPVQLSRQMLMITSLTGRLKCAGTTLHSYCRHVFGLYLENWVKLY
jgi:hypothetical protein